MIRPILGISMGDPFGNGPEITVRALADKSIYDRCKPLVVGDETSMCYAIKVAEKVHGIHLELNIVKSPSEGKYTYGFIDLMDLGRFQQRVFLTRPIWMSRSLLRLVLALLVEKHLSSM